MHICELSASEQTCRLEQGVPAVRSGRVGPCKLSGLTGTGKVGRAHTGPRAGKGPQPSPSAPTPQSQPLPRVTKYAKYPGTILP